MISRDEGLNNIYNIFNNIEQQSEEIFNLRHIHIEMDQAVSTAYGWTDLDLDHGFHETKQGSRFTISESARRIILDRLLALNHERYEEEVKTGLHENKASKGYGKGRGKKSLSDKKESQYEIFEE